MKNILKDFSNTFIQQSNIFGDTRISNILDKNLSHNNFNDTLNILDQENSLDIVENKECNLNILETQENDLNIVVNKDIEYENNRVNNILEDYKIIKNTIGEFEKNDNDKDNLLTIENIIYNCNNYLYDLEEGKRKLYENNNLLDKLNETTPKLDNIVNNDLIDNLNETTPKLDNTIKNDLLDKLNETKPVLNNTIKNDLLDKLNETKPVLNNTIINNLLDKLNETTPKVDNTIKNDLLDKLNEIKPKVDNTIKNDLLSQMNGNLSNIKLLVKEDIQKNQNKIQDMNNILNKYLNRIDKNKDNEDVYRLIQNINQYKQDYNNIRDETIEINKINTLLEILDNNILEDTETNETIIEEMINKPILLENIHNTNINYDNDMYLTEDIFLTNDTIENLITNDMVDTNTDNNKQLNQNDILLNEINVLKSKLKQIENMLLQK